MLGWALDLNLDVKRGTPPWARKANGNRARNGSTLLGRVISLQSTDC